MLCCQVDGINSPLIWRRSRIIVRDYFYTKKDISTTSNPSCAFLNLIQSTINAIEGKFEPTLCPDSIELFLRLEDCSARKTQPDACL
jgi:hypothetical protein